ncbi:MAG: SH3 domain-containing protein [Candidatus Omnitrophota bacterium]|nr:SH3 domain-containing protein [Candidatus Omnitrophota bacterium]
MVKVIEERYDWCKVILPKRLYCYVASPFLRKISDNKAEVVASELNLRSEPSQQSYIVGRARKGGIFFIKEENNGWVKVRGHPYMWGWINKSFLQKISEPLDLEIEGVIISVNKENCKANYLLKGKNGDYLLWIVGIEEKGFIHKKVKIVGKKVNEGCSYVWVQKIFPEK